MVAVHSKRMFGDATNTAGDGPAPPRGRDFQACSWSTPVRHGRGCRSCGWRRRARAAWREASEHAVAHSEAELTAFESELRARMEDLEATAAAVSSRVDALQRQAAALAGGGDVPALAEAQRRLAALEMAPQGVMEERA